ncbi:Carboxylesterase type B [Penicillium expansum]|nr:Carboxylesterase type B [Penicillium expansum]
MNRVCPQGFPSWFSVTSQFQAAFSNHQASSFKYEEAKRQAEADFASQPGDPDVNATQSTEDCLFLDVITPNKAFQNRDSHHLAPVLVWIHGGAYVTGNKIDGSAGDPTRLILNSQKDGSNGIVYVAINYRLGGLGWLAGREFEAAGGVPNLGLHDQRLALEWVQQNINLFGGDRNNITVAGGSAGAGSIMHHLIANGGSDVLPFKRAYIESPGWVPTSSETQIQTARALFDTIGTQSISEARRVPSESIIHANARVISSSKDSTFSYGPVVDGTYVPATPGQAFLDRNFNSNVTILASHASNEGLTFIAPYVTTDELFTSYLQGLFPLVDSCDIDYIVNTSYSLDRFNNSWYDRAISFIGDFGLLCNVEHLSEAYSNQTYRYQWSVFPAIHGGDFLHLFYNGAGRDQVDGSIIVPYADILQGYIANFVKSGNPNGEGLPEFPITGPERKILGIQDGGIDIQKGPTNSDRCQWLQTADLWA